MKKKIDISGVDPILFVGLNDQNIKVLEKHFESKIVVRGSNINLDGKRYVSPRQYGKTLLDTHRWLGRSQNKFHVQVIW